MLHVTCDVIGIAQYHFLKSKIAAMSFALYRNFKPFLVNLYWKTLETTETVLVTLIALNTRNLSKIVML